MQMILSAQDFWSTPSAGALIAGTIGLGVAIVGYLGTRENTRRQLDAERSRWRNDSILREVRDYLAAARALADQAYLVAGRQVDATPDNTEKKSSDIQGNDEDLKEQRRVLEQRRFEFSKLVHGARLLLAPNIDAARRLREESDRFFGYANNLTVRKLRAEVERRHALCEDLRIKLEDQVAGILSTR